MTPGTKGGGAQQGSGPSRHLLVWGWIRMLLAVGQMTFAVVGMYWVLHDGLHWPGVLALVLASTTTGVSRFLYGGLLDPTLQINPKDNDGIL